MKEHKTILLFIFGVLFASVLPLVDELVTVVAAWMEWLKMIPSRHIAKSIRRCRISMTVKRLYLQLRLVFRCRSRTKNITKLKNKSKKG